MINMARRAKEAVPEAAEAIVYAVASPTGLNVREKPDKAAKIMRVLKYGETVEASGEAPQGWIAIKDGYCVAEFLK